MYLQIDAIQCVHIDLKFSRLTRPHPIVWVKSMTAYEFFGVKDGENTASSIVSK